MLEGALERLGQLHRAAILSPLPSILEVDVEYSVAKGATGPEL